VSGEFIGKIEDLDHLPFIIATVETPPFGSTAARFSDRARVRKILKWAKKQNPNAKEVAVTLVENGDVPCLMTPIYILTQEEARK